MSAHQQERDRGAAGIRLLLVLAATAPLALWPGLQAAEEDAASQPVPRSGAAADAPKAADAAEAPAAPAAPATPAGPKATYNARLRLQYDYRKLGGEKDSDFYGYFYGDARHLQGGTVDLYASGRVKSDLDSKESASLADDPFHSVDESNGVTENRLLQLYGDLHDRERRMALRAGRQYIDVADYLHLDGGQLQLRENTALGGRIYGGAPVSYYSGTSGDYAGGVSVVGRPFEGNRSRLTLARYHDDGEGEDDQNYYLDLRQQFTETTRARGQVSVLNEDFRMGRLDCYYSEPEGRTDLSLGASYWGSFDAHTRAYSPLYNVVGEQDPYTYAYARLTQQLAPHWALSPGMSLRFAEAGDNGYNNRDYENYDVTLLFEANKAFSASVALEYWAVEDDDSFFGVSGEVRYRHGRVWEISGGASFAKYTYDTYSDLSYSANGGQTVISENGTVIEESPDVRTYYVRGRWRVTRQLALRAQFDVEDDEAEEDLGYRARGAVEVKL